MSAKRRSRGFTLIEVLIAVAIVGILIAIGLPAYTEQVNKGRRAEGKAALMKTMQLQERAYTANGTYQTDLGSLYGVGANTQVRSGDDPENANGWYVLSADTTDCSAADLAVCVRLVATPRAGFIDNNCGILTLNSVGVQTESGTRDLDYCWRR